MTTTRYIGRSFLPTTPLPAPRPRPLPQPRPARLLTTGDLAHSLQLNIETALMFGYWECRACHCRCERIEGEQGQPAVSNCCQSPRIVWHPPINQAITEAV